MTALPTASSLAEWMRASTQRGLCAVSDELQALTPEEIALGVREYLDRENVAAQALADDLRDSTHSASAQMSRFCDFFSCILVHVVVHWS
jgi:hypothetical protein